MQVKNVNTKTKTSQSKNVLMFFFFFLAFTVTSFSQNLENQVVVEKSETISIDENTLASSNTQFEFVSWFMGAKQPQINNANETQTATTKNATKKMMLSSGISPNKVLYRTIMKKVSSHDSAIV